LGQKSGIFAQMLGEVALEIPHVSFAQHVFGPGRPLEGL